MKRRKQLAGQLISSTKQLQLRAAPKILTYSGTSVFTRGVLVIPTIFNVTNNPPSKDIFTVNKKQHVICV